MNPAATPDSPDFRRSRAPETRHDRRGASGIRATAPARGGAPPTGTPGSSIVLLLLALLLAPLAVVAAWVQDTVSDTDRYVETVAPLASEPPVQEVVINRLTDRVVANVDVAAVTDSLVRALQDAGASPRVVEGAESLEGPLRNAVRTVVDRTVTRVITSDAFQQVWEGANRRSHAAVVNMLTGEREGAVRAEGDTVQLNVGDVVDEVRERLVDAGFDKAAAIPDTDRTITLFHTEELGKAQDAMRLLDILGTWLPVLTVVLAALAVWTAPAHRVMLMITATGRRRDDGRAARRTGRGPTGLSGLGPAHDAAHRRGGGDLRHVRPVPARQHAHAAGRRGGHGTGGVPVRSRASRPRRPHRGGQGHDGHAAGGCAVPECAPGPPDAG